MWARLCQGYIVIYTFVGGSIVLGHKVTITPPNSDSDYIEIFKKLD